MWWNATTDVTRSKAPTGNGISSAWPSSNRIVGRSLRPSPTFFRSGSRTTTSAQPVANCSVAAPAPPPTSRRRTPETGAMRARNSARSAARFRTLDRSISRNRKTMRDSPTRFYRDESSRNFAAEDLAEPFRVDIPSGENADDASFSSLTPEGGSNGRTAGTFRDDPVPLDEQSDRRRDFFQGNHERPFEQRPHQIPHLGEHARCADSIDETRDAMDLGRRRLRERRGERCRGLRLACIDASPRTLRLDRGRNPRAQPPAPERDHDRIDVGHVLEDLESDRPVARHHGRIGERMDERPPLQWGVASGDADLPDFVPGELNDRRAEPPDRGKLRGRRGVRHDRGAGNPESPRMPREGLRHVARAAREHAVTSLFRRQERDRVARAPDLERPGRLQVLQFQEDLRGCILDVQTDEWRPDEQALDPPPCGLNRREIEARQRVPPSMSGGRSGGRRRSGKQVSCEGRPPDQARPHDHPFHPAGAESQADLRDVQPQGRVREEAEENRNICEWRPDDSHREDRGKGDEDERPGRNEFVDYPESFGEDTDGNRADAGERNDNGHESVLERPQEEPCGRKHQEADEDNRRIEDQRGGSHAEVADVVDRHA